MLGSKLRSWMEAVRPRKKQQRKEKSLKSNLTNSNGAVIPISQSIYSSQSSENEILEDVNRKSIQTIASHAPRYSGTNLSSPESAYSTGYSTDGTSPGAAPPEYYINIRTGTRYIPLESEKLSQAPQTNYAKVYTSESQTLLTNGHHPPTKEHHVSVHFKNDHPAVSLAKEASNYEKPKNSMLHSNVTVSNNNIHPPNGGTPSRLTELVVNSAITSPRQRNRIRTNPWVPTTNLSPGNSCVGLHIRQEFSKQAYLNSPLPSHCLSPSLHRSPLNRAIKRRESISSSSCSSNSTNSINWDVDLIGRTPRVNSESDGEDCTLNEMMGKFDESYVYEKETDILSDSDPTDCDTDIDTGQDGGDEDDPLDHEFDFIDNGSYLDFNMDKDPRNTGHCIYYNYEVHRKMSRRKTMRKSQKHDPQSVSSKQTSEKRRRSTSSKRKQKVTETTARINHCVINNHPQMNGSRSAGTTPLSVRRTKQSFSKQIFDEHLKRRSNSVSLSTPTSKAIDQRDKEANQKYKELIVEAEHILMSMKSSGFSPRRIPGPPNKRVELLRNAESTKPDAFIKNRLIEDTANMHLSRIPSNNFNSPRFSPKKNHITNFINNNSPVLIRRELEARGSPIASRKELQPCLKTQANCTTAKPKSSLSKMDSGMGKSPKLKRKGCKTTQFKKTSFGSDSDGETECIKNSEGIEFWCPQSEPVKRKVYSNQCKTVAFNLNYENISDTLEVPNTKYGKEDNKSNSENLRQQVLLNTIASLKRSLEDQSESLRQVYTSSQNISTYRHDIGYNASNNRNTEIYWLALLK